MRDATLSLTSKEIARWSEPLVADHIYSAYENLFGGKGDKSEALGRQHCRMWRNLLGGGMLNAQFARRELMKLARMCRVDEAAVESIDAAIFSALLGLILRRGHGSIDAARLDGMALVQAASTLGEIRKAA